MELLPLLTGSALFALVLVTAFLRRGRGRRRRHLFKQQSARRILDRLAQISHPAQRLTYLRKIDPLVFEELILEAFERRGHTVQRNDRYTGDGGIDGRVTIHGKLYLIQAKRYSRHVSRQHVLDFAALLEKYKCHGLFCHTGRTGEFSREFHKKHPYMTIISGERLLDLLSLPPHISGTSQLEKRIH